MEMSKERNTFQVCLPSDIFLVGLVDLVDLDRSWSNCWIQSCSGDHSPRSSSPFCKFPDDITKDSSFLGAREITEHEKFAQAEPAKKSRSHSLPSHRLTGNSTCVITVAGGSRCSRSFPYCVCGFLGRAQPRHPRLKHTLTTQGIAGLTKDPSQGTTGLEILVVVFISSPVQLREVRR